MLKSFLNSQILLSNGSRVLADKVAYWLREIRDLAEGDETDREMLATLRKLALGEKVHPELTAQLQTLKDDYFLKDDGQLHEELGQVILASVRGVGKALHVDPPFVARRIVCLSI